MREIALWLWAILLADVVYHCLSEATDILEALVVSEEALNLFFNVASSWRQAVHA